MKTLNLLTWLFFLLSAFSSLNAQCDTTDGTATICDLQNVSASYLTSDKIDLSKVLGGTFVTGGTWTAITDSRGFDSVNATVDYKEYRYGGTYTYEYSYTGTGSASCKATATLNIGNYTGETASPVLCNNSASTNLFQYLGNAPSPFPSGTWTDVDSSGALEESIFSPMDSGSGSYTVNYILPAVSGCPQSITSLEVIVLSPTNSGTAKGSLILCNGDLSSYTDYDLFNSLEADYDVGGFWEDVTPGVDEVTSRVDSTVNLENIFNNSGAGDYKFKYTVESSNPSCPSSSTEITIVLQKPTLKDYTLSSSSTDLCLDQISGIDTVLAFELDLDPAKNNPALVVGTYDLEISITDPSATKSTNTLTDIIFNAQGQATFDISSSLFPSKTSGTYTISVDEICGNTETLSTTITVSPNPNIASVISNFTPTLPLCAGSGDPIDFDFDFVGVSVPDGEYTLEYRVEGATSVNGSTQLHNTALEVVGSSASFSVRSEQMSNPGVTGLLLTAITGDNICSILPSGLSAGYTSSSFIMPGNPTLASKIDTTQTEDIVYEDFCAGQSDVEVRFFISDYEDSQPIPDGRYIINYATTGSNTSTVDLDALVTFTGGEGIFYIPLASMSNSGTTNLELKTLTSGIISFSSPATTTSTTTERSFKMTNLESRRMPAIIDQIPPSLKCELDTTGSYNMNLEIEPDPVFTGVNLATASTYCPKTDITVTIEDIDPINKSVEKVDIVFSVTGSNITTLNSTVESIDVNKTNNTASFTIPGSAIDQEGEINIVLEEIKDTDRNCDASTLTGVSAEVQISTSQLSAPSIPNQIFCQEENPTVADLPQEPYVWAYNGNNGVGAQPTVELDNTFPLVTGDYIVYQDSGSNCESTSPTQTVRIEIIPDILPQLEENQEFCISTGATLNDLNLPDKNTSVYEVYDSETEGNKLSMSIILENAKTYWVSKVDSVNGCKTKRSPINVTIFRDNFIPDVSDATFCLYSNSTLNDVPLPDTIYNYVWYPSSTNLSTPLENTYLFTKDQVIYASIESSDKSCRTPLKEVKITINTTPYPDANPLEFSSTLHPTAKDLIPQKEAYKWYSDFTESTPITNLDLPLLTQNYYLTDTDETGCESLKVAVPVKISNPITGDPGPNLGEPNTVNGRWIIDDNYAAKLCGIDNPKYKAISDAVSNYVETLDLGISVYSVSLYSTLTDVTSSQLDDDELVTIDQPMIYAYIHQLVGTSKIELTHILKVDVSLNNCSPDLYSIIVPDGFSPNNDDINDEFRIANIDYIFPNYSIEVFNRFGLSVFNGDVNNLWNGKKTDGNDLESGLYYYYITPNDETSDSVQGTVYLAR